MNQFLPDKKSAYFLLLCISIISCLILLVNISFKLIIFRDLIFSVDSLICPLITGFYLIALRECSFRKQRYLLHISLISLYIFCIGLYILVNLPAAEYMHDNPAYQIIFDDIPKRFFAITMAFALGFYVPHLVFCGKSSKILTLPRQSMILALASGFCFFLLSFFFLFSGSYIKNLQQICIDSLLVVSLLLLLVGVIYLAAVLKNNKTTTVCHQHEPSPLYTYLVCTAAVIVLICLACEYRIIAFFGHDGILAASSLFFPLAIVISTLIGEIWGYRANLKLSITLIAAQFIFDCLLMGIIALPSPEFFNLNPFYNYMLIRRLPAASLTLFATFVSNAMLLHYLKQWNIQQPLRILIANLCANSLLCLVDYSLLYGGIYPYEQILNLVINVWRYKFVMTLLTLPLILKSCSYLERNKSLMQTVTVES